MGKADEEMNLRWSGTEYPPSIRCKAAAHHLCIEMIYIAFGDQAHLPNFLTAYITNVGKFCAA